MTYSKDYKIRKDGSFSLEGAPDPVTGKSEYDILQDIASAKKTTAASVIREALMEYFVKRNYLLARHPTMEQYIKNPEHMAGEPMLIDTLITHEKYIKSSIFTADELKRRARICPALSKLYDKYYFEARDQEWIKTRAIK